MKPIVIDLNWHMTNSTHLKITHPSSPPGIPSNLMTDNTWPIHVNYASTYLLICDVY